MNKKTVISFIVNILYSLRIILRKREKIEKKISYNQKILLKTSYLFASYYSWRNHSYARIRPSRRSIVTQAHFQVSWICIHSATICKLKRVMTWNTILNIMRLLNSILLLVFRMFPCTYCFIVLFGVGIES